MVDLLVQRSDVNKDLGLKAKDLGVPCPRPRIRESRYQD